MITFLSSFVKQLAGGQDPPSGPNGQGGEAGNPGGEQAFSRTFESVLGGNVPQASGETTAAAAESLGQSVSGEKGAMSRLTVSAPGMGRVAQLSGQGESVPPVLFNGPAAGPEGKAAETVSDEGTRNLQAEKTGKAEGGNVAPRAGGKAPEGAEKGNSSSGNPDTTGTSGDAQPAKTADPAAALNGGKPEQAQVSRNGEREAAVKNESGSKPAARAGGSGKAGNSRPLGGNTPKTAGPQTAASGEKAASSAGDEAKASSGQPKEAGKASAATGGQPEAGQKGGLPNGSQLGGAGSTAMNGDTVKIMENGRTPSSGETGKSGSPGRPDSAARGSTGGSTENGRGYTSGRAPSAAGTAAATGTGNTGGGRGVTPGGTFVSGQGAGQAMPAENIAGRPSPAKTISTDSSAGSNENGTTAQTRSSGGEARSGQSAGDAKGNSGSGRSASSGRGAGTAAGNSPRPTRTAGSSGMPDGSPVKSVPPANSPGAAGEAGDTPPKLSSPLSSAQAPDTAARTENTQGAVFQPINRVTEAEKEFFPALKSTEGEFKISSREMMDAEMSGERDFSGSDEGEKGEMRKLEALNSSLLQSSSARRKLGVHIGRVVRQEMAQSQEGQNAQWRHHRFVLDDGKSVNVSFRQADGAIQVQLGTGNAELNRLLQQNMDEIRQHLRQELDVEVDLEFQNFEGGEFREGHPEQPGRSGRGSGPAGTAEGTQAEYREDGARQTVRYLGFNTNEWTA